jgi:protein SCO1/2
LRPRLLLGGGAEPDEPSAEQLACYRAGPVGGPFELTDHTGRSQHRFSRQVDYFGFTNCPDAPDRVASIRFALEKLGRQPIRCAAVHHGDPQRDTPAVLAGYVSSFHPRLVGLTGEPAAIKAVARAYKTYFAHSAGGSADNYSVDHTGFIYVVGPDGRYRGFLPPQLAPDQIAEAIRPQLGAE